MEFAIKTLVVEVYSDNVTCSIRLHLLKLILAESIAYKEVFSKNIHD